MTFKARQVYVIMREHDKGGVGEDYRANDVIPVAVFYDLETAEGNAEGYNLAMKEQDIHGLKYYVAVTVAYE